MTHEIEIDSTFLAGRDRLTCLTCGETIVRQPYMIHWDKLKETFLNKHAPSKITDTEPNASSMTSVL